MGELLEAGTEVARLDVVSTLKVLPRSSSAAASSSDSLEAPLISIVRLDGPLDIPLNQDWRFAESGARSGAEANSSLAASTSEDDSPDVPVVVAMTASVDFDLTSSCRDSALGSALPVLIGPSELPWYTLRLASPQIPPLCEYGADSKKAISSMFGRTTDSLIYRMSMIVRRCVVNNFGANLQSL